MRVAPLLFALGGWLSMPAFSADTDVWLQRLAQAEQQTDFSGTFVYGLSASLSSHAVWHQARQGVVRERFLSLDGRPAEVVRVDGRVECASDELAAQIATSKGWQSPHFSPETVKEGYELRQIGESRVAGRPAVAFAVLPRDQHRYGLELHLDQQTALPLKALLLNEKNQLLERFQFTAFSTDSFEASKLEAGPDCSPMAPTISQPPATSAWRSDWVPPGFRLVASGERASPVSDKQVDWLIYEDGLARFSVYLESLEALVPDERTQVGATAAMSKRISVGGREVMVTVVGEIPMGTAERIALSMRPTQGREP
ncbi:MucB/RseB C-terminal domain-containing protein [Stutzerimonas tarimensis]|uniref:MucB/RseB C-terminal domain-containing protein n=1 Tax=Stutzerimonas tarimensis TaxID=1507735 RepID=A0ABV7TBW8_9GAMM